MTYFHHFRCHVDGDEVYPAVYFLEIWNLRDFPSIEFIIHLSPEWRNSVEGICWKNSKKILLGGMHGHILLIDVETQKIEVNINEI